MDWGGADFSATSLGRAAIWAITPADVATFFVDPTVIRSRLLTGWRLIASPANGLLLSVGAIAWTQDPDDTSVPSAAVVSDPGEDPNADWIILVTYPVPPGAAIGEIWFPSLDFLHESKAMRRLGNNKGILLVASVADPDTGADVAAQADLTAHFRYLLKE